MGHNKSLSFITEKKLREWLFGGINKNGGKEAFSLFLFGSAGIVFSGFGEHGRPPAKSVCNKQNADLFRLRPSLLLCFTSPQKNSYWCG